MNRRDVAVQLALALACLRVSVLPLAGSTTAVPDPCATGTRHGKVHPSPRPGIDATKVLSSSEFRSDSRAARAYDYAREYPHMMDGIYSYCDCERRFGHYSLLSCFEDRLGGDCHICMGEAELVHRMVRGGASLQDIRAAVDSAFGS